MCGIVGVVSSGNYMDEMKSALRLLDHRGPDSRDTESFSRPHYKLTLGHTRLKIIDLSDNANQPFHSNCGNYIIVFNGEIYNYQDLKTRFLQNQNFKTTSDTEVLLKLYISLGPKMLNLLDGMFAFCIFDKNKDFLFLARDQLGIKPLYLYYDQEKFIFSSEISPIFQFEDVNKSIDPGCFIEFFLNGFLYEPDTGFKNVKKLEPGSYIIFNLNNKHIEKKVKYWSPPNSKSSPNHHSLEHEIRSSISRQLVSDVPLGLFFSGGVDSTVIFSQLQGRVNAFTTKPEERDLRKAGMGNDYYYANKIARKFQQTLNTIPLNELQDPELFLSLVDQMTIALEEPISDYTFVSSQTISKAARDAGFTVMLSGMGADEIFGGYPRYRLVAYDKLFSRIRFVVKPILKHRDSYSKKIERFNNFFREPDFILKYTSLIGYFSHAELQNLFIDIHSFNFVDKLKAILNDFDFLSPLKKAMVLDLYGFLAHNFIVADRSSMQESLELRVPLATKTLFEITFRMDDHNLLDFIHLKKPLKRILYRYLPKSVVNRKKTGFNAPLDNILYNTGPDRLLDTFKRNGLFDIIKKNACKTLINGHFDGFQNNTYKLFQLLSFSFWYRNHS
jgi:asparagine synthase (glutamine-hydrolysing)